MAHFSKEEIEEIQRRLVLKSVKDSQFPETNIINLDDFVAIVQGGVNKITSFSRLYAEIAKYIEGRYLILVFPTVYNGSTMLKAGASADVYAHVTLFNEDVTDRIPPSYFSWERSSGNESLDNDWNSTHQAYGPSLHVTREDINGACTFYCLVPIECLKYVN